MRELFIYWKVETDQLAGALAAVRAFQAELALRLPVVRSRLYQRADTGVGTVTLMETYAQPGGLSAEAQEAITQGGDNALAAWCLSAGRHIERFNRLAP